MTNSTFKRVAACITLGACALAFSWSASAANCGEDKAWKMYSTINTHAADLKKDAEQNPSKVPFRSGKNDPRLKKSIKISKQTASINKNSLSKKNFDQACTDLELLAGKYNIDVGGEKKGITAEQGLKGALQAKAIKDEADSANDKRKQKKIPGLNR